MHSRVRRLAPASTSFPSPVRPSNYYRPGRIGTYAQIWHWPQTDVYKIIVGSQYRPTVNPLRPEICFASAVMSFFFFLSTHPPTGRNFSAKIAPARRVHVKTMERKHTERKARNAPRYIILVLHGDYSWTQLSVSVSGTTDAVGNRGQNWSGSLRPLRRSTKVDARWMDRVDGVR